MHGLLRWILWRWRNLWQARMHGLRVFLHARIFVAMRLWPDLLQLERSNLRERDVLVHLSMVIG